MIYYKSPHKGFFYAIITASKENRIQATRKEEISTMKAKGKIVEKLIASLAYQSAEKEANSSCQIFFHQPKLPEKVKKLRKF